MKEYFFCVCESKNCLGSMEWIEYIKGDDGKMKGRVNRLTKEGKQRYPWKIDFQFKKNWKYKHEDLICNECENVLHPIPFSEIDTKQRINIFNMSGEDRMNFANSYIMVKVLENNNNGKNKR